MTYWDRWPDALLCEGCLVEHVSKDAGWDESKHPRGKTTPESNAGSFRPADFTEVAYSVDTDRVGKEFADGLLGMVQQQVPPKLRQRMRDTGFQKIHIARLMSEYRPVDLPEEFHPKNWDMARRGGARSWDSAGGAHRAGHVYVAQMLRQTQQHKGMYPNANAAETLFHEIGHHFTTMLQHTPAKSGGSQTTAFSELKDLWRLERRASHEGSSMLAYFRNPKTGFQETIAEAASMLLLPSESAWRTGYMASHYQEAFKQQFPLLLAALRGHIERWSN